MVGRCGSKSSTGAGGKKLIGRLWARGIKHKLRIELDLLNRTVEQHYTLPEDRALSYVSDTQGL